MKILIMSPIENNQGDMIKLCFFGISFGDILWGFSLDFFWSK